MEKRSVVLRGIARILNAGGSTLLDIYDAATSIKLSMLPDEKGKLKAELKEYEKKIERLYYEIGKEVAMHAETAQTSAAAETEIKLVAEYRVKIESIKQCIREIEEEEKAAVKTAADGVGAKVEPVAEAGKPAVTSVQAAGEVSTGVQTEEAKERIPEAVEPQAQGTDTDVAESTEPEAGEMSAVAATEELTDILAETGTAGQKLQWETAESEMPVTGESLPGAETKQEAVPEVLETMLKGELLKICRDKGIDADQRMTKAAIVELIKQERI